MRVSDQPGYILHSRAYRETSLLLDVLSRDHGQVGLVARGVRKEKSRLRGVLQPLQPLALGWSGNGELATLTAAESAGGLVALNGDGLFAGMYLNELVLRLGSRGDTPASVFEAYALCLQRLSSRDSLAWTLRRFERDFFSDLGYAMPLSHVADSGEPIDPDAEYAYDVESGALDARFQRGGLRLRGSSLLALASDIQPDDAGLHDLRRLMRVVIRHHLGGGSLNAWQLRLR